MTRVWAAIIGSGNIGASAILAELGRRKMTAGQEAMIVDVALNLQKAKGV